MFGLAVTIWLVLQGISTVLLAHQLRKAEPTDR